jgi:hypothetical protein
MDSVSGTASMSASRMPGVCNVGYRMIKNELVAREISQLMLDIGARIDKSVDTVMKSCPAEELQSYRRAAGAVMGEILLSILNPLYSEHPSLKPPELK